jgi:hypothetical protein
MNKIWRVSILLVLTIGLVLMSAPAAFAGGGVSGPPPPPPSTGGACYVVNGVIIKCHAYTGGSQSGSPGSVNLTGNGSASSSNCSGTYPQTVNALQHPISTVIVNATAQQISWAENQYDEYIVGPISNDETTPSSAEWALTAVLKAFGKYKNGATSLINELGVVNSDLQTLLVYPSNIIPPGNTGLCYNTAAAYTISCASPIQVPGGYIVQLGVGIQIPTLSATIVTSTQKIHTKTKSGKIKTTTITTISVQATWTDYEPYAVCTSPMLMFEASAAIGSTPSTLTSNFLSTMRSSSHPMPSIAYAPSASDPAPSCLGCSGTQAYVNEEIGFWPINGQLTFTCTWTPANQNPNCPLAVSGKNPITSETTVMTYTPTSYTYMIKYDNGHLTSYTPACQGSVGPPSWSSVAPIYVATNNPNSMNFNCASAMTPSSEYGIGVSSPYPSADGVMASPSGTTVSYVQIKVEYTWSATITVTTNIAGNCAGGGSTITRVCEMGPYTGPISETATTASNFSLQVIAQQANATTP